MSRWARPWAMLLLLAAAAATFAVADAHSMETWSKDTPGATGGPHARVHAHSRVAATGEADPVARHRCA